MTAAAPEPDPSVARRFGLWWGTVEGLGLVELIDLAAATGYGSISTTPAMYLAAREDGITGAALRSQLAATGITVAVIDPLITGLPGIPDVGQVGRRFRSTFEPGPEECLTAARALDAAAINVAHFLGASVEVSELVVTIAELARAAGDLGVDLLVEFMPEGSIPDLATAAAIIDAVDAPRCGLTLDTWHLARTGGTASDVAALAPGTVRVVQVGDGPAELVGSGAAPPSADRLVPGEGALPLAAVVAAALANNPEARIGPEVFSRVADGTAPRRAETNRLALDVLLRDVEG